MANSLRDLAEFESATFRPFLPDESQVNPGVYGAELAYWLASALAAKGVTTSYPEYEDQGWYIEYISPTGSEFAVHVYNIEGSTDRWSLMLRRHPRKMFGRDKPPYSEAATLVLALREALESEPSIMNLRWSFGASPTEA